MRYREGVGMILSTERVNEKTKVYAFLLVMG